MARGADNRKVKGRIVRLPKGHTAKNRAALQKQAEWMSTLCSDLTAEQWAEICDESNFATTPRYFKEAMRSFGIPLPKNANRMVQNV